MNILYEKNRGLIISELDELLDTAFHELSSRVYVDMCIRIMNLIKETIRNKELL